MYLPPLFVRLQSFLLHLGLAVTISVTCFLVWLSPARAEESATQSGLDAKLCAVPDHSDGPSPADKKAHKKAQALLADAAKAYQVGDYQSALTALQESFAIEPLGNVLYNIAQTCREAGRDRESLTLYEKTLRLDPGPDLKTESERHIRELKLKLATAEEAAAKAADAAKDYEKASEAYARAYALQPKPVYLFRRAEALRQAEKLEEAAQLYTQYLTADASGAEGPEARKQLARTLAQRADDQASRHFKAKEYVQASMSWESAYQQDPRPLFVFRKAEAMYQAGQRGEAKGAYQHFLKISPPAELHELRQQAQSRLAEIARTESARPVYKRPWFWVAVAGGVVAAAAIGLGLGLGLSTGPTPPTVPPGTMVYQPNF